ncbi:MAG: iolD [Nocardioides sp.]|jgi:3D-(3,5/4)-trihydroxycyclohexane-1,2-dione acylhydrolase (decyclizing)|uniref:3D-(3,5/4)-trihydroxycyclohexane-1,2-dione acylhydrolase (decyclizing) n=1 Tax=Nocardioides sp. TaxID=35761 RepID=UPI0026125C0C|nr:3D-(3,5/4)-trihydroxycyclohexane-1,2-dione acylhydrolase (decyclizing) [Nocardioides sp.]MCW2835276.1 iolD [Nocardioides sp.]
MTETVRLTTAEALVRWLVAQKSELLDGSTAPLFPGVFGIFGHGNVLGLGVALHEHRDEIPTWRGQTEQGMALAAVAYARAMDRRQVMVATSSVGPGALNMVTAAGLAHANRLPILLLPGDTFTGRAPDPVLQQVEHFGDPTTSVNDAFRSVSRYFDRITRPEQLLSTLPQVARVLTDPADCGPVTLALPQDVQAEEYDFPVAMFAERVHRVPRPRPDVADLASAANLVREARRPLLVLGGGVRYSGAGAEAIAFAEQHHIPVVETVAGRTLVPHEHPLFGGALGIIGSSSANALALEADLVLAVGTRLQDFTTSSWTGFASDLRLITINAARFDAVKHAAHAVTGDAREALVELGSLLGDIHFDESWAARAAQLKRSWDDHVDIVRGGVGPEGVLTYATVTGIVNDASTPDDYVLSASGGMPGELHGGWRTGEVKHGTAATSGATMDLEYGFSCMGYEVVAPWGAAMAREQTHPNGIVTSIFGDGSYLMLNSEIYSAAFAGHPYVAVLCDNEGFAVIHRLQTSQGAAGFNNLLQDSRGPGASEDGVRVDFAAHAAALGAHVEVVPAGSSDADFRAAYTRARDAARAQRRPAVVTCVIAKATWTEAGAWWETGVPASLSGHESYTEAKQRQVRWLP